MGTTGCYIIYKHVSPASTGSASESLPEAEFVEADLSKLSAIPIAETVITKNTRHLGLKEL
jgi:hypothetical protein